MDRLPRPRAILLDLDDTIIDDGGGLTTVVDSGWETACREGAAGVAGLDAAALKSSILAVRDWYWSDAERHRAGRQDLRAASTWIVGEALRRVGIDRTGLAGLIANRYRDIRDESLCLFEGAIEALERMRSSGSRLALVTNGSSTGQRAKIQRFGLAAYFDHICIEGESGYGKPDERVYRDALSALNCDPSDAWMAGDNLEWDVAAPMRLGIWGVWVDHHAAGLPADPPVKPDRIVRSISELA